jgi:hypothetical protein
MTAASVTGQACPSCGAEVGDWCKRGGGALLACPARLLTCNGCGAGVVMARRRVHNIAAIVKAYQAEAKRATRCGHHR